MIVKVRTYWTILRVSIEERLVYRADFFFATFMRFMPIVTTILLWRAVYNGIENADPATGAEAHIKGYTYNGMVAYYLLVFIGRAFSSMPGLASGIARDVRDGTIKKYLIQPVDLVGFLFWSRVAHKLVYYATALVPFAVAFYLCRGFFPGWPDGWTLAGAAAALIMGFIVGFLFEVCIGLVSFWFLEVSSLLFIWMMLNYFLSGHMFPLDLPPAPLDSILKALPFQYFAYFPATVMLGRLSHAQLLRGLLIQLAWAVVLLGLCRILLARGVRRYSAFGG
jgi:ABC-2 type transport system permease protein